MASSKTQFTHIAVEPDDSDEFVVEAGIPAKDTDAAQGDAVFESNPATQEASATAGDAAFEPEAASDEPEPTTYEAEAIPSTWGGEQHNEGAGDLTKGNGYHEQTLEDLEAGPMSKTQKYVIAFLIIFVIGFIAYCFLFFGK